MYTKSDPMYHKVHATVDLWSSRVMEPILGIRLHYMDAKFTVHVRTVAFRHFGERHTGINITTAFEGGSVG